MLFLLLNLPSAQAADADPAARWGHQAVYLNASNEMYIVGGASSSDVTEVTNDVYVLSLGDSATWNKAANTGLPAHAFAAMTASEDTLTVVGGMTASCASDTPVHTFKVGSKSWSRFSPSGGFIRRHGAGAATTDDGTMVVGGLVDKYVCSSNTAGYAAYDVLSSPSAAPKSARLPYSLTGGKQAVSDFAMASTGDKVYLAGGQSGDGTLVPFSTIGVWTKADGWSPRLTTGSVPAGRLGASLVAHPTLDALILFGGSTKVSSTSFSASSLVALLNTTTWEWSIPDNVQPGHGAAVSYHSAVMTPHGVMIAAFGRNNMGSPSSGVSYLDMRDPTAASWAWTSKWSPTMNQQFTTSASEKSHPSSKSNKGTIAAAVVPTILGLLILIPLCFWLYRRHKRNKRHQRLTSHFDFATQEDRGDFSRPGNSRYLFNSSFGSEGSLTSISRRVMTVFRKGTKGVGDDGTIHEGEMVQVPPAQLTAKGSNWEEIDFGLGRVDAERREGNYTDLPARLRTPRPSRSSSGTPVPDNMPFPMPIASTIRYPAVQEPAENPFSDSNQAPAVGELVRIETDSPRLGSPRTDGQLPLLQQQQEASALELAGADAAAATEANDWNMLEQSMMARPIFKTSPNPSLRSHASPVHSKSNSISLPPNAHVPPSPSPSNASAISSVPSLPPLQFAPLGAHTRSVSGSGNGNGNGTSSRHLAGSGSPRRYSQQAPPPMSTRERRGSVNALGLQRNSRLRVANPSEQ